MYIKGEWYTETEVQAYVAKLDGKIAKLEEDITKLEEALSLYSEEEYD